MSLDQSKLTIQPVNAANPYDQLPYDSHAFVITHPSRMSALAQLFNLNPPQIEMARVLELGCAAGGNLIPLSFYYPNMTLVGVDYSQVQIEQGQKHIEELGLKNIELMHKSIADITADFGQFDYIIAHGLYSWVSNDIKDSLMRICNENLTENGIAYISYNTYPGWKINEISRDAMQFHTRNIHNPTDKVAHGRGMLQFLQENNPESGTYRHILDEQVRHLMSVEPYYIAHEYLEEYNQPCYFIEFVNHAYEHGLRYVSESNLFGMFASNYGAANKERLLAVSDNQVELEQYSDFLTNRTFRETLICKASQDERIERNDLMKKLKLFSFHADIKKDGDYIQLNPGKNRFTNSKSAIDTQITSYENSIMQVMAAQKNRVLSYEELLTAVTQIHPSEYNEKEFLTGLERLVITDFVCILHAVPPNMVKNEMPKKPKLNPQAVQYALITGSLVNATHGVMSCSSIVAQTLLPHINGTHTESELIFILVEAVQKGQLQFIHNLTKEPITKISDVILEAQTYTRSFITNLYNSNHLVN